MPEEKNEGSPGMPCGLPKSGNVCMNRTTACCLKCGWNPDEQVRRRALPLVKGADGSAMRRLRKETPALHPAHGKSLKHVRRESV